MSAYDYDKRGAQRKVIQRCAFYNERDRRIEVEIMFAILSVLLAGLRLHREEPIRGSSAASDEEAHDERGRTA